MMYAISEAETLAGVTVARSFLAKGVITQYKCPAIDSGRLYCQR